MNLQEIFESMADEDDTITVRSYSGRGMYGKECLGVEFGDTLPRLFAHFLRYAKEDDLNEYADAWERAAEDSMGRKSIVYFPSEEYQKPEEQGADYVYDDLEECKDSGDHLLKCDEDGYCKLCGNQDEDEDE